MKKLLSGLLDWIYKKRCYFCKNSAESVKMCTKCYNAMEILQNGINRNVDGINIYCAGEYSENLQKLIRGLKYHNQRDLAFYQAKFMFEYWEKLSLGKQVYQVVPVPLYKTREKSRKYNHMMLVAEEFCKLTGYSLNYQLVERIKDTRPQYKLNKSQRMDNLSNAFRINADKMMQGPVLLIDDICTTGSTFESIICELKKNNISDIVCFATTTPIIEN